MTRIGAILRSPRTAIVATTLAAAALTGLPRTAEVAQNRVDAVIDAVAPHRASGRTVIVEIDDRSQKAMPEWPWPRSVHARMTRQLHAVGAAKVLFDVAYRSPAPVLADDLAFASALRAKAGDGWLGVSYDYNEANRLVPTRPEAILAQSASLASMWLDLDPDFMTRRIEWAMGSGPNRIPSIASVLADRPAGSPEGSFRIDWSINPNTIPHYSYVDVLNGRYPKGAFDGRNVIIGATAEIMKDQVLVPVYGYIPGVYVHGIASETIRAGAIPVSKPLPFELATLAAIAGALLMRRARARTTILAVLAAATILLPLASDALLRTPIEAAPETIVALAALLADGAARIVARYRAKSRRNPLTGMPNAVAMREDDPEGAHTVVVRVRNHLEIAALLGEQVRSDILRSAADRIATTWHGVTVYHVDASSFAVRLPIPLADLLDSIQGLHALFMSGMRIMDRMIDVTVCVGVSDVEEVAGAISTASLAANHAAENNARYEIHQNADDRARWQLSILTELDEAVDSGEVWVAYQPKYDVRSKTVTGAEALVRWTHGERGFVPPDVFIPIAEGAGRIEKLTMHVLETAIRDFAAMEGALTVSVNISAVLLGQDLLHAPIVEMLARHGLAPERLTLEITESAEMTAKAVVGELERLRALGLNISIDDYGTGQATLSYLQKVPGTELKIDRSFVSLLLVNHRDELVVASTIMLAHNLGMKVVAEGVETREILDRLADMGCDEIQGYYIGKPMRLSDFTADVFGRKTRAA